MKRDARDRKSERAAEPLERLRRRQFLGLVAGVAAGAAGISRGLLGASFLADPPGTVVVKDPCTKVETGTSTSTGTVTFPSGGWSTVLTITPPRAFSTTGYVYTTISVSGATTVTTGTATPPQTTNITTAYSTTVVRIQTVTQAGTLQTITVTYPAGALTGTITASWTYTVTCPPVTQPTHVVIGVNGVNQVIGKAGGEGVRSNALRLSRGVSSRPFPGGELGLGV